MTPDQIKRPLAITIVSWIFIVLGIINFLRVTVPFDGHTFWQLLTERPHEFWPILLSGLVAAAAGVLMLYGSNWGRLLLVVWVVEHIFVSALHSIGQLIIHVLIFGVLLYFVFRRRSPAYFHTKRSNLPKETP